MGKLKIQGRTALNGRVTRFTTLLLGTTALVCAGAAQAQTSNSDNQDMSTLSFPEQFQKQVVEGSTLHGMVGVYDFRRWHDSNGSGPGVSFNKNTAYGANGILQTGSIYGFSAGAELVFAKSFYGNSMDHFNGVLPNHGTQVLMPQGYLQFNAYGFQLRGGRQLLNTPLAAADQFTFAPRAFNGVTFTWQPLVTKTAMAERRNSATNTVANQPVSLSQNANYETDQYLPFDIGAKASGQPTWQLFGAYINGYEGRFAGYNGNGQFNNNNRYLQNVGGFYAFGTTYSDTSSAGQVVGQYFHYSFDKTETADYVEGGYMTHKLAGGFAPYVRAQAVAAYNGNGQRIPQGIDSQIYGLKLGVMTDQIDFSIFGDFSPVHNSSFNHGQMLKPYTDLSGVIYTDTMNDGVQNFGPGYGLGAKLLFNATDHLAMYARYVYYNADYGHGHDFYFSGQSNSQGYIADDRAGSNSSFSSSLVRNQKSQGIGLGMTYDLGGISKQLAGLTLGDNLGITKIDGYPNFYDNRIRLKYSF